MINASNPPVLLPLAFLALLPLFAQPVEAQSSRETIEMTVKAGERANIWQWARFDETCKTTEIVEISVRGKPRNGTLATSVEKIKINQVSDAKFERCIGRNQDGKVLYYNSKAGTSGTDKVTVTLDPGKSYAQRFDIIVNVVP